MDPLPALSATKRIMTWGEGERKTPRLALPHLGEQIGGEAHQSGLSAVCIECETYLTVNFYRCSNGPTTGFSNEPTTQ